MQLSTFGESKTEDNAQSSATPQNNSLDPKDTTNSIGEGSTDVSEASTISPQSETVSSIGNSSTEPESKMNNTEPVPDKDLPNTTPEIQTGTMPEAKPVQAESIKPNSKGKRFISIFFLLLILVLAGAASYYFFVVRQNQSSETADTQSDVVDSYPTPEPTQVESFANDTSGLVASDSPDGLVLAQMQTLVGAIDKEKSEAGTYPWDSLGNKPAPLVTPLFNTAGEPYVSWLKAENNNSNPLKDYLDIATFTQDTNSKTIQMVGFNSWYAFCFAPNGDEYASQTVYSRSAEEVGEGGEYICIKKDIKDANAEPDALEGF